MKAAVYAVSHKQEWEWRYTIHPETDRQYWFQLYDRQADLVWLEPIFSLGQALWLVMRFNSRKVEPRDEGAVHREAAAGLQDLGIRLREDRVRLVRKVPHIPDEDSRIRDQAIHECISTYPAERLYEALEGRQLLREEMESLLPDIGLSNLVPILKGVVQLGFLEGRLWVVTGLTVYEERVWWRRVIRYRCNRCGSTEKMHQRRRCPHCGGDCPYCEQCLTMGRSRFCSLLVRGTKRDMRTKTGQRGEHSIAKWGLSPAQTEAVEQALHFLSMPERISTEPEAYLGKRSPLSRTAEPFIPGSRQTTACRRFLLWAVTGAGKTEMLFPLIDDAISYGGRVLIATPRKDVVLELLPRVQKAFPGEIIVGLFGGSPHRWEQGTVTVATTHQLLRFYESFDLVVIDELDAFPFHNNPMLTYAAGQVGKKGGGAILLSATPPKSMQKETERGRLPHVRVPVRFHGHPLPVPRSVRTTPVRDWLKKKVIPRNVRRLIQQSIDRGAQLFIFVTRIEQVDKLVRILQDEWPYISIGGTASTDAERTQKVQDFRSHTYRVLVTTTILERGVTIAKSDVFIVDSDCDLFDEAALVQMAGRAGRSAADPAGHVFFLASTYTNSQKGAIREIKKMNRMAGRKGYLMQREGNDRVDE